MKKPPSRGKVIEKYVTNKSVLDLGVVQHSLDNAMKPTWIHRFIVDKALECIGVDIEPEGIEALRKQGYDVICSDVQALNLKKKFEVIVAGELIEHLHNFEGFLRSIHKHLVDGGRLIITTPNSLFIGYSLAVIRKNLEVHKQHTCWFDEVTLAQLLNRFDFEVETIEYLGSRRWLSLPIPQRVTGSTLMIVARKANIVSGR